MRPERNERNVPEGPSRRSNDYATVDFVRAEFAERDLERRREDLAHFVTKEAFQTLADRVDDQSRRIDALDDKAVSEDTVRNISREEASGIERGERSTTDYNVRLVTLAISAATFVFIVRGGKA
jgi:hypothetical protein